MSKQFIARSILAAVALTFISYVVYVCTLHWILPAFIAVLVLILATAWAVQNA